MTGRQIDAAEQARIDAHTARIDAAGRAGRMTDTQRDTLRHLFGRSLGRALKAEADRQAARELLGELGLMPVYAVEAPGS